VLDTKHVHEEAEFEKVKPEGQQALEGGPEKTRRVSQVDKQELLNKVQICPIYGPKQQFKFQSAIRKLE